MIIDNNHYIDHLCYCMLIIIKIVFLLIAGANSIWNIVI